MNSLSLFAEGLYPLGDFEIADWQLESGRYSNWPTTENDSEISNIPVVVNFSVTK